MPVTLSLAMIVRNEDRFIERVLACAKPLCDEMIVVDTGSTDRTVELAEKMGAKVFHFKWIDDFAAARNFSFDQCTCDWMMWLDADDVITEENQKRILEVKRSALSDQIDIVVTSYDCWYDKNGRCTLTSQRERLTRRVAGLRFKRAVHEGIDFPSARALHRHDIRIEHRSDETSRPERLERNRRILERSIERTNAEPDDVRNYAFDLANQKKWAEAKSLFLKYLDLRPNTIYAYDVLDNLSLCESQLGNDTSSLEYSRKALALDSTRAESFVRIAIYHYKRQEWAQAIPYLRAASSLKRGEGPYVIAKHYTFTPWDLLSYCYEGTGDYATALECALKALSFDVETKRVKAHLHELIDKL
jgi:glycosyltransferase involved in cell wall biosynthesis